MHLHSAQGLRAVPVEPQQIGRLCPGCGEFAYAGCCTERRRVESLKVWTSARWKRLKRRAHERDDWTCVDCPYRDETETGKGLVADHELGFDGPEDPLAWDLEHIVTRCLPCSGRKDGGRHNVGRTLQN